MQYKKIFGVYDFTKQPFALGDIILFLMNLKCLKALNNSESIEILVKVSKYIPSNLNQSNYINQYNYSEHFINIINSFQLIDKNNIYFVNNEKIFNVIYFENIRNNENLVYPNPFNYFLGNIDYSTHRLVNKTFNKLKKIPHFESNDSMRGKLNKIKKGKKIISINIRSSSRSNQIDTVRDANYDNWIKFLKICSIKFTDIYFLVLGKYEEFDINLLSLKNTFVARYHDFSLIDELQFLLSSDCFIGSSSGFANLAIFSNIPYSIMSMKKEHEKDGLIKFGKKNYIFSFKDQNLIWNDETTKTLLKEVEKYAKNYL